MMYFYIMTRTQISLTDEDRRLLDHVAGRTGRSMAGLIRDAIRAAYGASHSSEEDLAAMRGAFGAWGHRTRDGAAYVDELRSGRRVRR